MRGPLQAKLTAGDAIDQAVQRLDRARVPDARHDAELLLAHLLGVDRSLLLTRRREPLDPSVSDPYDASIDRRRRREPLQHILGSQEFYGLSFRVDSRALIPRPETEGIVDAVLELDLPRRARVADLGTGSGCIIVTLAHLRPDLEGYALDISSTALELAHTNAAGYGVDDRIEFREGPMDPPPTDWHGRMDVVVCNPPYVTRGDWIELQREVRDHDPRVALVAGPSGLESYQAVIPASLGLLRPEGWLILELGYGQGPAVSELVLASGFRRPEIRPDLRGIPRILIAERP